MKPRPRYRALTLAVHVNSRSMAWVAFEGPFAPYHWGKIGAMGRKDKNEKCLRQLEKLLQRLTPETLVLEAFERPQSGRHNRMAMLGRAMVSLAVANGVDVAIHPFADVQQCFQSVGASTRQEIARAVARQIPALENRLPRRRRAWDAESWWMPLFCAAALVLTQYQREARRFLDGLW